MPGTIRVSVLEFMDLPKLFPSPISIKVSMGKRHYETSDKGDFSFPLTTLRDDVFLIIQDAEGNEISRAGVHAKSIVEKGLWDDLFPLQGGGQVHLQFQFSLSEDDRNRVRMMRETALRKKQVERQDRNLKSSASNLASSLYLNPELSDLNVKEATPQSPSASTENIPDEKLATETTKVVSLDQMPQLSVENDAVRYEESSPTIPMLQEVDVNKPEVNYTELVEKIGTQTPHADEPSPTIHSEEKPSPTIHSEEKPSPTIHSEEKPSPTIHSEEKPSPTIHSEEMPSPAIHSEEMPSPAIHSEEMPSPAIHSEEMPSPAIHSEEKRSPAIHSEEKPSPAIYSEEKPSPTIHSEENLFHSQGSGLSKSPQNREEKTLDSAKALPRRRTPSNVKKVISAFESSLTQDTRPRIKPTLRNTQSSVVEKQTSLNVKQSNKATEEITKPTLSEMTADPPLEEGDLTRNLPYIKQKEHKRKFIEALDGTILSEDARQALKLKGKSNQTGGEDLSEKDKMHKERNDMDAKSEESYQTSMTTTKWETDTVSERMMSTQQPSTSMPEKPDNDRNSVTAESKMRSPARSSGTSANEVESISRVKVEQFPSRRSGSWLFPDEGRRSCVTTGGTQMLDMAGGRTSNTFIRVSMEENRGTSETKANGGKHNHQKMIKPERSDDVKSSEGPFAHAFKIAIMIGFGTLVLLTRQRKKKK